MVLNYQQAGVDSAAISCLLQKLKSKLQHANMQEEAQLLGGFCSQTKLPEGYQEPILVSCTDGVGTKLLWCNTPADYYTIGWDVVAMCVNDLITIGATPLTFLDYIAYSKLPLNAIESLFDGMIAACQFSNMKLVGGETAQMPALYHPLHFDVAGFCTGIVEQKKRLGPHEVLVTDKLFGVESSGIHANGFSLLRKILPQDSRYERTHQGKSLHTLLMQPTHIYAPLVKHLYEHCPQVHALAHITGGGLVENTERALPSSLKALIEWETLPEPSIIQWLKASSDILLEEQRHVFNMGVGFVIVAEGHFATQISTLEQQFNLKIFPIGKVKCG